MFYVTDIIPYVSLHLGKTEGEKKRARERVKKIERGAGRKEDVEEKEREGVKREGMDGEKERMSVCV